VVRCPASFNLESFFLLAIVTTLCGGNPSGASAGLRAIVVWEVICSLPVVLRRRPLLRALHGDNLKERIG
jgi:hypothetical protein